MGKVIERARLEACSAAPLLITGEAGTGKTNLAYFIHHEGPRKGNTCDVWAPHSSALIDPYVSAFGGRSEKSPLESPIRGAFEVCDGGSLVVDCLDLLDRPQQELILDYLEDALIRKPGSSRWQKGDVRLMFCLCLGTPRDTGAVHEELERKLAENTLHIPPLRERREDVGPLFEHFVIEAAHECGRMKAPTVTADAINFLSSLELSDNAWTLRHAARVCAHLYPDSFIDRECLLVAMQEGLRPLT